MEEMTDKADWEDLFEFGDEIDTSDATSGDGSIDYVDNSPYTDQAEPPKKKRKLNDAISNQIFGWRILPAQFSKIINSQGIILNSEFGLSVQCPNFSFSNELGAWLHFKGNNFQVITQLEVQDAQYLNSPLFIAAEYDIPVESFAVEISAMSSFKNSIDHSLLCQMAPSRKGKSIVPHLPIQAGTPTVHARLKFETATKKKAGTGPSEFFHLIVSLLALNKSANVAVPVVSYVSDPMIVVGTTPGRYGKTRKGEQSDETPNTSNYTSAQVEATSPLSTHAAAPSDVPAAGWTTTQTGVHTTRNVGINTREPNEALTVQGNVFVTGNIYQPSDRRLKTKIKQVSDAEMLQHIEDLPIYDYEWKDDSFPNQKRKARGVIAQEVQKIIPGAVTTVGRIKFGNLIVEDTLAVDEKTLLMENMGATRALGKKVTVMSRCQKILIGLVVFAALIGIGIGTGVYITSRSTPSYAFPIDVLGNWRSMDHTTAAATSVVFALNAVMINTPTSALKGVLVSHPRKIDDELQFTVNVTEASDHAMIGLNYECSVALSICPREFLNMTTHDTKNDHTQIYRDLFKDPVRSALTELPELYTINYKVMCGPADAYIHLSQFSEKNHVPELVLSFRDKSQPVLKGFDADNNRTLNVFLITEIVDDPVIDYVDASRAIALLSNYTTETAMRNQSSYAVLVSTDHVRALIGLKVETFSTTDGWIRLSYAVLSYSLLTETQAANYSATRNNTVAHSPTNETLPDWPALNVIQHAVIDAPFRCRGFDYDTSGLFLSHYTAALNTPDLLYDGDCYRSQFTATIQYDDLGFISDLGHIDLTEISSRAALLAPMPLKTAINVVANRTYVAFETKQHVRALFAFKVTSIAPNSTLALDWVPLFFATESITSFAPGFAWSARNKPQGV